MLAEIQAEAAKEQRSSLEVLQDAVMRYVREKRFTEQDVPRLIAEFREEQRQG